MGDIKKIKAHQQKKNKVKLWLSTAHKAKGLEAPTVVLAEDYKTFKKADSARPGDFPLRENNRQEVNLLYVALTRAKKRLYLNKELTKFLAQDRDCPTMKNNARQQISIPDDLLSFVLELTVKPPLEEAIVTTLIECCSE